ncbi:hypothetical protein [Streptomyces sp. A5-4]|uniref:hypothetical protein n=1 Tax=Streptomyces sp. A5-4 TaxID=3384771 RepID=UPI003DA9A4F7
MSRRTPPPPPPAHLRAWPDRDAMRADRGRAMDELSRRYLGPGRLAGFWGLVAGVLAGWGVVGVALQAFVGVTDPITVTLGAAVGAVGLAGMVTAGIFLGVSVRRDRAIRSLLVEWAAVGEGHGGFGDDARWRAPGLSLAWMLPSLLMCGLGLWASFGFAAGARAGADTYADAAFFIGLGALLWVAGLIGAAKAVRHYRWALRGLARAVRAA